jgi:hypothetical protein
MLPEKEMTVNYEIPLSSKNERVFLASLPILEPSQLPSKVLYTRP